MLERLAVLLEGGAESKGRMLGSSSDCQVKADALLIC
jgi:hypothetical protein